jgi:serine/threonine-protein kinase
MTLSSGTKLGHYEIRSLVGAGGMGEVYLAVDTELDRTVAIKMANRSTSLCNSR